MRTQTLIFQGRKKFLRLVYLLISLIYRDEGEIEKKRFYCLFFAKRSHYAYSIIIINNLLARRTKLLKFYAILWKKIVLMKHLITINKHVLIHKFHAINYR